MDPGGSYLVLNGTGHIDLPSITTVGVGTNVSVEVWVRRSVSSSTRESAVAVAIFAGKFELVVGTPFGTPNTFAVDVGKAYVGSQSCVAISTFNADEWYQLFAVMRFETKAVSDAVDNGSGVVRTTIVAHGLSSGRFVKISGVSGTEGANGVWEVEVVDADTVDLVGSTYDSAFVSGGQAVFGEVELYVNAVSQGVVNLNGTTLAAEYSSTAWSIGSEPDKTAENDYAYPWVGDVDRVAVWDEAVDDAFIASRYGEAANEEVPAALFIAGD